MNRSFPASGTALVNTAARGSAGAPPGYTPYQYATLRYVPRIEREEFINVGVVVYAQAAQFLDVAWHVDHERIRAFTCGDEVADITALRAQLSTIVDICAGRHGGAGPVLDKLIQRFGWVSAPRSTVLQPGPVHGGICTDILDEPQRLLDLLVR